MSFYREVATLEIFLFRMGFAFQGIMTKPRRVLNIQTEGDTNKIDHKRNNSTEQEKQKEKRTIIHLLLKHKQRALLSYSDGHCFA